MKTYFVYILRCSDDSLYTGITGNFDKRWIQHQQGYFIECYTFKRRPLLLEYYLEFNNVMHPILFEKQIKGWSRVKKQALINGDFDGLQILSECRNFRHFKFNPDSCQ